MMNPEDVPAEWVEKARGALIDHDSDHLECYDHENRCCPVGEAHGFPSREEHQARAVLAAVLPEVRARVLTEVADELESVPDYAGTIYDQGRVDQRHMDALVLREEAARLTVKK